MLVVIVACQSSLLYLIHELKIYSRLIQAHVGAALGLLRCALLGDNEQARPSSPDDFDDDDDDDDDGDGGDTTTGKSRTPPRTPAKGSVVTFCPH